MRAVEDLIDAGVEVWYYIENRRITLATAMDKIMFAVQSGTAVILDDIGYVQQDRDEMEVLFG